jgi:hypothetical protein
VDAFSYLSVLLSIIVGLAITEVLQGYRTLLLARSQVVLYGPSLIWSALLLVFAAQFWWASFGLAAHREWSFATFGIILLQTIFLYMMSAIVLPDVPDDGELRLRDHYYRQVTPFFTISLLMLAVSVAKEWMLDDRLPDPTNLGFHAAFATMSVAALSTRRPRVHEALAGGMVLFAFAYIAILFAHLAGPGRG